MSNTNNKINKEVDVVCAPEQRVPMHKQVILGYPKEPGYEYYWVDDIYDKVMAMRRAGWEHVIGTNADSHSGLSQVETSPGSYVTRRVNYNPKNPVTHNVLMRIRKELFDADFADQQALIAENEKKMHRQVKEGHYGDFNQQVGIK